MLYALVKPDLLAALIAFLIVSVRANSTVAFDNNQIGLEEQGHFAPDLGIQAQNFVMEEARAKFGEMSPKNAKELVQQKEPRVLVFVSSSMPVSLLKAYAKEAKEYNGVLVFKGLPHGSFKNLSSLIMEIYEDYDEAKVSHAGSIIDDEAFAKFGIPTVPSIILVKEEDCITEQNCKVIYDKIVGNIGIKAALEKFKDEGDMGVAAANLLTRKEHGL